MRKIDFTEKQVVKILKEFEGGRHIKEICREYGASDATSYNRKAKYGGVEASDIRRLKGVEEENRRLKLMYADLSLKHEALNDIVEKNSEASREARAGRPRQRYPSTRPHRSLRVAGYRSVRLSIPPKGG